MVLSSYFETGLWRVFRGGQYGKLNDRLHDDGYRIAMIHPFISERISMMMADYEIRWYSMEDIE